MVLYYSATGNTEFAAKEIARLIDDECLNLLQKISLYAPVVQTEYPNPLKPERSLLYHSFFNHPLNQRMNLFCHPLLHVVSALLAMVNHIQKRN